VRSSFATSAGILSEAFAMVSGESGGSLLV
jgi:hypothetical protein